MSIYLYYKCFVSYGYNAGRILVGNVFYKEAIPISSKVELVGYNTTSTQAKPRARVSAVYFIILLGFIFTTEIFTI